MDFGFQAAARVGGLDVGFVPGPNSDDLDLKFVYLANADDWVGLDSIPTDAFVVYQVTNFKKEFLF